MLWVYVVSAFDEDSPLRDLILQAISNEAKEEAMTYEQRLRAEGWAEGEAKSLLLLLESRAIAISAAMRERVLATRDEPLLMRWLLRAVSMTTAEEVFAPLEAGG